jgi:hypothetical protein
MLNAFLLDAFTLSVMAPTIWVKWPSLQIFCRIYTFCSKLERFLLPDISTNFTTSEAKKFAPTT